MRLQPAAANGPCDRPLRLATLPRDAAITVFHGTKDVINAPVVDRGLAGVEAKIAKIFQQIRIRFAVVFGVVGEEVVLVSGADLEIEIAGDERPAHFSFDHASSQQRPPQTSRRREALKASACALTSTTSGESLCKRKVTAAANLSPAGTSLKRRIFAIFATLSPNRLLQIRARGCLTNGLHAIAVATTAHVAAIAILQVRQQKFSCSSPVNS